MEHVDVVDPEGQPVDRAELELQPVAAETSDSGVEESAE
jgi:hypothetical protein